MPLTPEWANFFTAELAALAALTGFVVVAISINLSRILSYPHLPTRAGEALIGPIGAITRDQRPSHSAIACGAARGRVAAIGLVMVVAPIVFQVRTLRIRRELSVEAPAGSRHKGFEEIIVQDLMVKAETTRYRRERWETPDGEAADCAAACGDCGRLRPASYSSGADASFSGPDDLRDGSWRF